ncbi:MAG: hypothetical protein RLZZ436_4602, partial [Planctomycetota bacterium]
GDVVLTYHSQPVQYSEQLMSLIGETGNDPSPGSVDMLIRRGDQQLTIAVAKGRLGAVLSTQFAPSTDTAAPVTGPQAESRTE